MRKNKLHMILTILTSIFLLNLIFFSGCAKVTEEEVSNVEEKELLVEEAEEAPAEEIEKEIKAVSPQEMALILAEEEIPELDLADEAIRFGDIEPPVSRTVPGTPPSFNVGDIKDFLVYDEVSGIRDVKAELYHITDHTYMWVEVGASVDKNAVAQAAERFENYIYPTNRDYFGEEWSPGVDNDPHIYILHLAGLGDASGLFGNIDEYTTAVIPDSNQCEIFFVNLNLMVIGDDQYLATLAHEFQHMIQWNNQGNEAHWLDEGLAQLAEYLNGFDTVYSDTEFLKQYSTQLNAWVEGRIDELRYYGASYLFLLYLWERFGDQFIKELSRHPKEGLSSIDATLAEQGLNLTVDDVFSDWILANYLDDTALAEGQYGYQSETLSPLCPSQCYTSLPVEQKETVPQYAADYIEIEGQGEFAIEFKGAAEVSLIPTEAHSGKSFWWSNHGDDAYMTLTRAFDLSGLDKATLQFWTWYDIQQYLDYAYIEVSVNNGKTWEVLSGKQTIYDPMVDYAPHYNGISGKGTDPQWIKEEIDLSTYVGREIMLRFEYTTDTWFNGSGFAVDEIAVPELGYIYDAETGEDGWEGDGFVRTSNKVSQNWTVQLVIPGDKVTIEKLKVAEDGIARTDVSLADEAEKAILIIGAMAPVTKEEAQYELKITGELTGAEPSEPTEENVLFQDDFSYICSGWETYSDSMVKNGYVDEAYLIEVKVPEGASQSILDQQFGDVLIEVDTIQKVSATDNSWGVVCRYQDENNYYLFEITNGGFYSVNALVDGMWITLVDWAESVAINQGSGAKNQLIVSCKGDQLSFKINGKLVAQVRDSTFSQGSIGLQASTYTQGGAVIIFDNLVVRQL